MVRAKVSARSASAGTTVSSVVLAAYQSAADAVPDSCHLEVSLLAAIGQVESGNLAGRDIDTKHRATPAVLGPVLDGNPHSAIRDTDAGLYDDDSTWDRAVGPMQFIPSTWIRFGVDLDGDGVRDPQDMEDAAGAAAAYLCFGGRDLATESGLRAAVLSYNHSVSYLALVLSWKEQFDVNGFGDIGDPVIVPIGTNPAEPDTSPTDDPPGGTTTEAGGPLPTLPPTHPPKDPPTQPPTQPPTHPPTPTPTGTRELPPTYPPTPVPTPTLPPTQPPTPNPDPTPDPSGPNAGPDGPDADPTDPTPDPTDPTPDPTDPTPDPTEPTDPTVPPTQPPAHSKPTPKPTPTPIEAPTCEPTEEVPLTDEPTELTSETPAATALPDPDVTALSEDPTAIPIDPCAPPVPPADGTEPSPIDTAILSAGD